MEKSAFFVVNGMSDGRLDMHIHVWQPLYSMCYCQCMHCVAMLHILWDKPAVNAASHTRV